MTQIKRANSDDGAVFGGTDDVAVTQKEWIESSCNQFELRHCHTESMDWRKSKKSKPMNRIRIGDGGGHRDHPVDHQMESPTEPEPSGLERRHRC